MDSDSSSSIDRPSRDLISTEVKRWLSREISDAEFKRALGQVESEDGTVQQVIRDIELLFPENSAEDITLFKHSWNHLQRLLLVLASDCHIEREAFHKANIPCQITSGLVLACLIGSYLVSGFNLLFVFVWILCGIAGVALLVRTILGGSESLLENHYDPFASEEEMLVVARRYSDFQKTPPPPEIKEYVPRAKLSVRHTPLYLTLVICAPVVLGVLMFPVIGWSINSRVVSTS